MNSDPYCPSISDRTAGNTPKVTATVFPGLPSASQGIPIGLACTVARPKPRHAATRVQQGGVVAWHGEMAVVLRVAPTGSLDQLEKATENRHQVSLSAPCQVRHLQQKRSACFTAERLVANFYNTH